MKLILTTLTAIGLAFLISHSVHAHSDKSGRIVKKVTEKLNLTESQQSLLQTYIGEKKQLRMQARELRKERKLNPHSMGDLAVLSDDTYLTVDQINNMIDAKHAKRKAARQASIVAFVNFRNSLSVDQRQEGAKVLKRLFKMNKHGKRKGMQKFKVEQQ